MIGQSIDTLFPSRLFCNNGVFKNINIMLFISDILIVYQCTQILYFIKCEEYTTHDLYYGTRLGGKNRSLLK